MEKNCGVKGKAVILMKPGKNLMLIKPGRPGSAGKNKRAGRCSCGREKAAGPEGPRRIAGSMRPRRMVVMGFVCVILAGAALLGLPVSSASGRSMPLIDSLFTSASAVCVTGLTCVDPGTELSIFGQIVLAGLIQIGGLGITSIGVIAVLSAGGRFSIGKQQLLREGFNLSSGKGLTGVVKSIVYMTVFFDLAGAVLSYFSFCKTFPPVKAAGVSLFHSIASFNNAGFDILGNYRSLQDYRGDMWLCFVTSGLVIFGGLGFFVVSELASRRQPARWSLHTKVVLAASLVLLAAGAFVLKFTEGERFTWWDAVFQSVSARTAGFASVSTGEMSKGGLLILMALMFIGASPGSTGGGIKTTTFFVLIRKVQSIILNRHCSAFKRKISQDASAKAFLIFTMAAGVIFVSTFALCMMEPDFTFEQILFEAISAFATTGLSTGITPLLSDASKLLLSVTMFIGRLGPLTMATIWSSRELPAAAYSTEDIAIG